MAEPDDVAESEEHVVRWKNRAEMVIANIAGIIPGPYDVVMIFGHEDHSERVNGQPERSETARVTMSWAHLKSMIPLMARAVAAYEEQYGSIPAPGFDEMWKE